MHRSSINLGGQRLDSWDQDLEGLPRPLCLAQLLCSAEKDNQSREVTAQSPTACQGGGVWLKLLRDKPMGRTGRRGHQQSLRSRSASSACPVPNQLSGEGAGELAHYPAGEGGCHLLPLPSGWQRSAEWLSAPNPLSAGPEPRDPLTGPHCSLVPTTERKPGNYR